MNYCPKCGCALVECAEFCQECGADLGKFTTEENREASESLEEREDVATSEDCELPEVGTTTISNEIKMMCELCGKGEMEVVDSKAIDIVYRCINDDCGAYFGEFMHTGKAIFYSVHHLRLGQFIVNESDKGGLLITATPGDREGEISELARLFLEEIESPEDRESANGEDADASSAPLLTMMKDKELNKDDVIKGIEYLIENDVIEFHPAEGEDERTSVRLKVRDIEEEMK